MKHLCEYMLYHAHIYICIYEWVCIELFRQPRHQYNYLNYFNYLILTLTRAFGEKHFILHTKSLFHLLLQLFPVISFCRLFPLLYMVKWAHLHLKKYISIAIAHTHTQLHAHTFNTHSNYTFHYNPIIGYGK